MPTVLPIPTAANSKPDPLPPIISRCVHVLLIPGRYVAEVVSGAHHTWYALSPACVSGRKMMVPCFDASRRTVGQKRMHEPGSGGIRMARGAERTAPATSAGIVRYHG